MLSQKTFQAQPCKHAEEASASSVIWLKENWNLADISLQNKTKTRVDSGAAKEKLSRLVYKPAQCFLGQIADHSYDFFYLMK